MDEIEIRDKFKNIYKFSEEYVVENKEGLENVVKILQNLKKQKEQMIEYWKSPKETAKKTYQEIVNKEKEMVKICEEIEKNLKEKIKEYKMQLEKRLKEINEEAEKSKKERIEKELKGIEKEEGEEREKKLKEIEKIEKIGEYKPKDIGKVKGLSSQKRWQVRIIENKEVPSFYEGEEIRSINTKKILEIRKEKPEVKIPGIEFYQEEHLIIRTTK